MSISFAGLGLLSLRNPYADLVGMVSGKGDIRSLFCLVVFCIVSLVLAYLTNPSENSFRAYLTEQSFRQHLSRLDDSADDHRSSQELGSNVSSGPHSASDLRHTHSFDNSSPFHFANRASISLRTPKHVFHSFAVFTIAAMVPVSRSSERDENDGWMISDSWYIGAFGRWWRGGVLENWYQDVIARSKDEESWSSGIISMKSLDMLHDFNGLGFSPRKLSPHLFARGAPPKLRNRERTPQKSAALPARSLTPPPLPKTASLPLHSTRLPAISIDRPTSHPPQPLLQSHSQVPSGCDAGRLGSSALSKSPSTLFDQSPLIAEVLRQISLSKSSVVELRNQLSECQTVASNSHALLQEEVGSCRERKRHEDATKLELKTRTKALDDSKRNAEGIKKDAEKKLRLAQAARDGATQRMDHLDKEIVILQQRCQEDEGYIRASLDSVSDTETDLLDALERKKQEIKAAEDVVAALNHRSRELEERLSEKRLKLKSLKEQSVNDDRERSVHSSNVVLTHSLSDDRPSVAHNPSFVVPILPLHQASASLEKKDYQDTDLNKRSSHSQDRQSLAISRPSVAASAINSSTLNGNNDQLLLHSSRYGSYGDSVGNAVGPRPFIAGHPLYVDSELSRSHGLPFVLTPSSQSLIPSGLISSIDNSEGFSRSFQSESDAFVEKDWHGSNMPNYPHLRIPDAFPSGNEPFTSSPTSLHGSHTTDTEYNSFQVRVPLPHGPRWDTSEIAVDASWTRGNSDPRFNAFITEEQTDPIVVRDAANKTPRRWFSSREKPKKGLNPDAKEFSLFKKPSPGVIGSRKPTVTFDALNPTGLGPSTSTSTTNSSFLRAFAPSPAEREALQRALGGSSNTSFERLPSLSDVGSIPSSPSHMHGLPQPPNLPSFSVRESGKSLPAWLQALPRIRKVNFSPWDDDEPVSASGNGNISVERR